VPIILIQREYNTNLNNNRIYSASTPTCIWVSTDDSIRQYRYNIITAVRAHELLIGFAQHFGNSELAYLARTRTRPIVERAAHINVRDDDIFIKIF